MKTRIANRLAPRTKRDSEVKELIMSFEAIDTEKAKAMCYLELIEEIANRAEDSELQQTFFEWNKALLNELAQRLNVSPIQVVLFAVCLERDDCVTIKEIGNYLSCSNIKMMMYVKELNDLKEKHLLKEGVDRLDRKAYSVRKDVIEAFEKGLKYEYMSKINLTAQALIDELDEVFDGIQEDELSWEEAASDIMELMSDNRHLSFANGVVTYSKDHMLDDDEQLLLCFLCVALVNFGRACYSITVIEKLFHSSRRMVNAVKKSLVSGDNGLIQCGLIESACNNGIADGSSISLTEEAKKMLLCDYNIRNAIAMRLESKLMSCSKIKKKDLFYNEHEGKQIGQLASLLDNENFMSVQKRLDDKGLRKGFACLLYGDPGTGKTESVYQLARMTGRDIFEVNVEEIKSKWVGETESNIRQLFRQYYELCKCQTVVPILLFNEADAILGKRKEGAEAGVDKMENSLQNIILQEMERLEGIMIATTNLTENLDKAFERRFIYKVQFKKPGTDVKAKIWKSMLPDLTEEETSILARRYDMSGGMIENVTRKKSVTEIITGNDVGFDMIKEMCDDETIVSSRKVVGF